MSSRVEVGFSAFRGIFDQVCRGAPLRLFQHRLDDPRISDRDPAALASMMERRRQERRKT